MPIFNRQMQIKKIEMKKSRYLNRYRKCVLNKILNISYIYINIKTPYCTKNI